MNQELALGYPRNKELALGNPTVHRSQSRTIYGRDRETRWDVGLGVAYLADVVSFSPKLVVKLELRICNFSKAL
jgi:hypothetical protein